MKPKVRSCLIGAGVVGALAIVACAVAVASLLWLVDRTVFTPPDAEPGLSFAVAPDGATIVFSAMDGNLYKLQLGSDHAVRIVGGREVLGGPRFFPDGRTIVYSSAGTTDEGCHLWILDLEAGTSRQVTFGRGVYDTVASVSPDGSRIAFIRSKMPQWDAYDLYVLDVRTGAETQVTHNKYAYLEGHCFSPDGSRLVFAAVEGLDARDGSLHSGLFEVEVGPSAPPHALGPQEPPGLKIGAWAAEPVLLPGGEKMVFVSDRLSPYVYELFLSAPDGTNAVPIGTSRFHTYIAQPATSPDGKSVFYFAATGWTVDHAPVLSLWEVSLDGTKCEERVPNEMLERPRE